MNKTSDYEAERRLVGCLLMSEDSAPLAYLRQHLAEDDVEQGWVRDGIAAAADCLSDGVQPNLVHLPDRLRRGGATDETIARVIESRESLWTGEDIEKYVARVLEAASRRRLRDAALGIVQAAERGEADFSAVRETAFDKLAAVDPAVGATSCRTAGEVVDSGRQLLMDLQAGRLPALPTGLANLDKLCSLRPTSLTVLAARPGMGKTALAVQLLLHACENGMRGGMFSLEMGCEELFMRVACSALGVSSRDAWDGCLAPDKYDALHHEMEGLRGLDLFLDDRTGLTIDALRARAKLEAARMGGVDVIVVDYIQLMGGRGAARHEVVADISRGLKVLAKELHCAVIGLAQLNRKCEDRSPPRPITSDLRESGALEQDADNILLLYRAGQYGLAAAGDEGATDCIVAKQRNGRCGVADLWFEGPRMRFYDR